MRAVCWSAFVILGAIGLACTDPEAPSFRESDRIEIAVDPGPTAVVAAGDRIAVSCVHFDFGSQTFADTGSVVWIDPRSLAVVGRSRTPVNPQAAVYAEPWLAVVSTGDYGARQGAVSVFDPETMALRHRIEISGYPSTIAVDPNRPGCVLLGSFFQPGIAIVDVEEGRVIADWQENAPYHASALAARKGAVFAVDFDADLLIQLDAELTVFDAYPVGDGPVRVVLDPNDPNRVEVLCTLEETIVVVQLSDRRLIRLAPPTGRAPNHLLHTEEGLWVTSSLSNLVELRSPVDGAVWESHDLGPNRNPMEAAPWERRVFVSELLHDAVAVIER